MNSILAKHAKEVLYILISSFILMYIFLLNNSALTIPRFIDRSNRTGKYVEETAEENTQGNANLSGSDLYYKIIEGTEDIRIEGTDGNVTEFKTGENETDRSKVALRVLNLNEEYTLRGNTYQPAN